MAKNVFLFLISFVFTLTGLSAGPERYDHLDIFKQKVVTQEGPKEEIVKNESGKQIARAVYKYNQKKQISEIEFFNNNKEDGKNVLIYDENGLKQEELFNKDNKLVEKVVYIRDKEGLVTEFEVFDENNTSVVKWKFQYRKGVLISGTRYIGKEASERFVNEYSPTKINQSIYIDNNEKAGSIIAEIENSKIVKRTKTDFTGTHTIEYVYDKLGRIEKLLFYSQEENSPVKLEKTHIFNYSEAFKEIKLSEN